MECQAEMEIAEAAFMTRFINKAGKRLKPHEEKMGWERPWPGALNKSPAQRNESPTGTGAYRELRAMRHPIFNTQGKQETWAMNFLPMIPIREWNPCSFLTVYRLRGEGEKDREVENCLEKSYNHLNPWLQVQVNSMA